MRKLHNYWFISEPKIIGTNCGCQFNHRRVNSLSPPHWNKKCSYLMPFTIVSVRSFLFSPFQQLLVPLPNVKLHLNWSLKSLFDTITAATEKFSRLLLPKVLMFPQVFTKSNWIECENLSSLSTIFATADSSVQGFRVDHVLIIWLNLIIKFCRAEKWTIWHNSHPCA